MNDNHNYPLYNKADHTARVEDSFLTRREWLEKTGTGFGALALSTMLFEQGLKGQAGGGSPLAPKQPPRTPKAKRVLNIFLAILNDAYTVRLPSPHPHPALAPARPRRLQVLRPHRRQHPAGEQPHLQALGAPLGDCFPLEDLAVEPLVAPPQHPHSRSRRDPAPSCAPLLQGLVQALHVPLVAALVAVHKVRLRPRLPWPGGPPPPALSGGRLGVRLGAEAQAPGPPYVLHCLDLVPALAAQRLHVGVSPPGGFVALTWIK